MLPPFILRVDALIKPLYVRSGAFDLFIVIISPCKEQPL
jgi:hypothetical protein